MHGPIRLPRVQRHFIYACAIALTVTGLVWLVLQALTPSTDDALSPWRAEQQWAMRLHAAVSLLSLIGLGSLLTVHVRSAWHRRKNRGSGAVNVAVWALLAVTGYLLGYAPEGGIRHFSAWLHWGVGCALPLMLVLHVWLGRHLR